MTPDGWNKFGLLSGMHKLHTLLASEQTFLRTFKNTERVQLSVPIKMGTQGTQIMFLLPRIDQPWYIKIQNNI